MLQYQGLVAAAQPLLRGKCKTSEAVHPLGLASGPVGLEPLPELPPAEGFLGIRPGAAVSKEAGTALFGSALCA